MAPLFYWLVVGILAVWRITHLFYGEDGPWNLMVRLRARAGQGFWGELLDCFYCLSLWVALPFAALLGEGLWDRVLLWPAFSAGAIMLQRLTAKAETEFVPTSPEGSHNVLRQNPDADACRHDGESPR